MMEARYDREHDVMHVFLPPIEPADDEEVVPGVFVSTSEATGRVVEVHILDFSRRSPQALRQILPPAVDVDRLVAGAS